MALTPAMLRLLARAVLDAAPARRRTWRELLGDLGAIGRELTALDEPALRRALGEDDAITHDHEHAWLDACVIALTPGEEATVRLSAAALLEAAPGQQMSLHQLGVALRKFEPLADSGLLTDELLQYTLQTDPAFAVLEPASGGVTVILR